MDMCICLCQNTGAMNRSPTLGGVFRGYFVGVRCIINNPFAAKWQAVSSRRGRFIVPVYTCSPYIRKTLGHIWQSVSSRRGRFIVPVYTCSPHIRKTLGHIWQSVSNIIGRLLAAVGADLSCPHIYILHAFAIRLKHIHVMFATCSLSVCYIFAV